MQDITVQELKLRLDAGEKVTIIDVREPYEYEEFNIQGKLIPLGELPSRLSELEDLKDSEIVVHCKSGGRSSGAKAFMTQNGFTNVRNLLGGMMSWQTDLG